MIEPVEIQITRHHAYKSRKPSPGCAQCDKAKYHPNHLGQCTSFNALGSGNQFTYQAMKKGWQEALTLALEASGLPRNLDRVLAEAITCFPERRRRDQGNHRMVIEKALGDALVSGGWLADDTWDQYEFGGLRCQVDPGQSWTRLMLFPALADRLEVAA